MQGQTDGLPGFKTAGEQPLLESKKHIKRGPEKLVVVSLVGAVERIVLEDKRNKALFKGGDLEVGNLVSESGNIKCAPVNNDDAKRERKAIKELFKDRPAFGSHFFEPAGWVWLSGDARGIDQQALG